jgi:tetratricopeptide (TPR) repeat protein
MSTEEIHGLMGAGRYAEAYDRALMLAGTDGLADRERANLLLMGAQSAARLGRHTWAAECVERAHALAAGDDKLMRKAHVYVSKAALRAGDLPVAEESLLRYLADLPADDQYRPYAILGLAQVYEGRRRWQSAASTYLNAAQSFEAAGEAPEALCCLHSAAWCYMLDAEYGKADDLMTQAERRLGNGEPRHHQVHAALVGYLEYQVGNEPDAFGHVVRALDFQQPPSSWAACLASVTSGLLAWGRQDEGAVRASLQLAESLVWDAVVESGPCYLRDLVHDLRCKVLLRWGQV